MAGRHALVEGSKPPISRCGTSDHPSGRARGRPAPGSSPATKVGIMGVGGEGARGPRATAAPPAGRRSRPCADPSSPAHRDAGGQQEAVGDPREHRRRVARPELPLANRSPPRLRRRPRDAPVRAPRYGRDAPPRRCVSEEHGERHGVVPALPHEHPLGPDLDVDPRVVPAEQPPHHARGVPCPPSPGASPATRAGSARGWPAGRGRRPPRSRRPAPDPDSIPGPVGSEKSATRGLRRAVARLLPDSPAGHDVDARRRGSTASRGT